MKKVTLFILIFFSAFLVKAQTFQSTIKTSPLPGKFRLFIKPSGPITGGISSVTFTIAIPSSITPRPTITVTPILAGLTFVVGQAVEADNAANNYYSYAVVFDGNGIINLAANEELAICDMEFGGVTGVTTTARLCNFPDGGADLNHVFYIAVGGTDRVNYPQPFYGPGAVNNGGGLPTYSYVPLSGVTLPVKFASFFAYKQSNDGLLNWTVENQNTEVKHFEIERSFNGISFNKIAQQNPTNSTNGFASYSLTDANVFDSYKGTVYYRIKQVDRNDVVTYSAIKTLKADSKAFSIILSPNPVVKTAKLALVIDKAQQIKIQLVDALGKVITNYSMQAINGINEKNIDLSSLANGVYAFLIHTSTEIEKIQFVKSN
jgi:Secretion system C-terminal sorting domain